MDVYIFRNNEHYIIDFMYVSTVFALANLMNVKEDHSQLSAIARYLFFFGLPYLTKSHLSLIPSLKYNTMVGLRVPLFFFG